MLESSSNWPTREWVERAVINQYKWLESKKSAARSRAMWSARGHRHNDNSPIRCPLCSRTGHSALKCCEFQITLREKKSKGCQTEEEHGGNGGGSKKAAEGAATVEAEAVKIASGAEEMPAYT